VPPLSKVNRFRRKPLKKKDLRPGGAVMQLAQAISEGEVIIDGDNAILLRRTNKKLLHAISGALKCKVACPDSLFEFLKYETNGAVGSLADLCKRAGLPEPELKVVETSSL
jgi:hypothetical protein